MLPVPRYKSVMPPDVIVTPSGYVAQTVAFEVEPDVTV
jgi:hypothetical protein